MNATDSPLCNLCNHRHKYGGRHIWNTDVDRHLIEQANKLAASAEPIVRSSAKIVTTRDREKFNQYHRDRRAALKLGMTVKQFRAQKEKP